MRFVRAATLVLSAAGVRAASPEAGACPDLAAMLLPRAAATNLQTFTGALAGVAAEAVAQSGDATRQYAVGSATFKDFATAAGRSCDNQHNACAQAANSKDVANVTVNDCDSQNTECKAAASSATQTAFLALVTSTDDVDIFCDL